jgi:type I restriction enzyme S subunit
VLYRIGDIYAERSERGAADMELLSVTMNGGVMQRSEIEGKDNSSEDKSNYKVVCKGDMVYNSMRMWQGANGVSPYDGIVSPAYTVLTAKLPICNEYFAALFKNYKLINEFRKNSQGMTSDTWNLKYPQIKTIKVYLPRVTEQEKVASLLVTLDKRIAAQATLVEQLKKYKRGLLSCLLGEKSTPGWTTTKHFFSEIAQRRSEKYDPSSDIEYPCVELENIEPETGKILATVPSTTQSSIKNIALSGDTLFGKLRPYLRKYAFAQQTMVCSSEIWALIPTDVVLPKFLFYLVQTEQFLRVANISSGTKMPRAEWSNIEKAEFFIPDFSAQRKAVSLLAGLDQKITFADSVLLCLNKLKASLLQQLFI